MATLKHKKDNIVSANHFTDVKFFAMSFRGDFTCVN